MKTSDLKIFIVDDSALTLDIIANELTQTLDCKTEKFTTAEDCLIQLHHEQPDLILADYYLDAAFAHKMNGDRMLSQIKKHHPTIPVIMYSSKNSLDVVIRLMKLGAVDFIPKETNFIHSISKAANKQVNKLVRNYEEGIAIKTILMICAVFVGSLFFLDRFFPDALPYYMLTVIVFTCIYLLFRDRERWSGPEHHHAKHI